MASKRVLLALLFAILMVLSLTTLMKIYDKDRITNDQKKADREIKREKMRAELNMGKRHDAKMKKKIIETLDRIPNNDIDSYSVRAENLLVTCIKSDNNVTQPPNSDRKRRGVPDKCLNLAKHLLGSDPSYDNNSIPQLRSKPGAANRVHLDFDGYTIQNTGWNDENNSIIEAAPYRNESLPFVSNIMDEIFEIWCGIAEDFMPFDLDVTTIDPGIINATTGKILFTPNDGFGLESCNCGGVAYVGHWGTTNMSYVQPALVFTTTTRSALEAGSHELGHNLGLRHDGNSTSSYYQGNNQWAPIMGFSDYASMATFDAGSYPDANNQEDDIAIIKESLASASNSNGFRTDEAEITVMTNATFVGVINFRDGNNNVSEEDVFEYTITGTPEQVSIDVGPYLTENYNGKFGLSVNFNGQTITRNNACKRDEASSRILLNTSDVVGKLTITVRSSIPDEGLITTASQLSGTYILSVDENPTLMGTTDCEETSTLTSTLSSTLSSTSTSTLTSTFTSTFSSSIEDDSNNMNLIIGIASGGVVLVGFIFVVSFKSSICLPSAAGYKLTTNTNP